MRKVILVLGCLGLVSGMIFAESKKEQKQKPEPRIEKLGKVLFLEIVTDNQDNIPKELLPTGVKKIAVKLLYSPEEMIRYNEKEKKLVYIEPPHFTSLLRKKNKYTYKALVKHVFKNVGPKRDEIYIEGVPCFDLPKKIGNIEIISYTKGGIVKIKYEERNILLKAGESWNSKAKRNKIDVIKFLGFNDAEEMAKRRMMDISLIHKLTSEKEFYVSSQTKITNYGIVDLEVEIYE